MQQSARAIRILKMLESGRTIGRQEFLEKLEISPATLKRDLEYLRSQLNAPISWSAESRGYRLLATSPLGNPRQPIPGLWLDARELLALLTIEQLLEQIEPRVLGDALHPIRTRARQLLDFSQSSNDAAMQVTRRIRVLPMHRRPVDGEHFERVVEALLLRRQLAVVSIQRVSGQLTARTLSPQRLVSYRDNWYLDAWCHFRMALRTFALDSLKEIKVSDQKAIDIADARLDEHFASGYGIFGGSATAVATLRFSAQVAGWVGREQWHPEQRLQTAPDGGVILEVPYSNPTELIRDILRWGTDVEVISPPPLREQVGKQARALAERYV